MYQYMLWRLGKLAAIQNNEDILQPTSATSSVCVSVSLSQPNWQTYGPEFWHWGQVDCILYLYLFYFCILSSVKVKVIGQRSRKAFFLWWPWPSIWPRYASTWPTCKNSSLLCLSVCTVCIRFDSICPILYRWSLMPSIPKTLFKSFVQNGGHKQNHSPCNNKCL